MKPSIIGWLFLLSVDNISTAHASNIFSSTKSPSGSTKSPSGSTKSPSGSTKSPSGSTKSPTGSGTGDPTPSYTFGDTGGTTGEPTPFNSVAPTPSYTFGDTGGTTGEPTPFDTGTPAPTTSPPPTEKPANECSDKDTTTALFEANIQFDYYGYGIEWWIYDVTDNGKKEIATKKYKNKDSDQLRKEVVCLDPSKCYQFTIFDLYYNGLCCNYGYGFYKIFYESKLIGEGAEWGGDNFDDYYEHSIEFGQGCTSSKPSISHVPSQSPSVSSLPTDFATLKPSAAPSATFSPTVTSSPTATQSPSSSPSLSKAPSVNPSDVPTMSPSLSMHPSIAPTGTPMPTVEQGFVVDPYNKTRDQRQIYPLLEPIPSYAVPDCTNSTDRVGCISIPRASKLETPEWQGRIHFAPPTCETNDAGRIQRCRQNLPETINAFPNDMIKSLLPEVKLLKELDSYSKEAYSVVLGDLNMDGIPDILMGFAFGGLQVWMSNIDGTFTRRAIAPIISHVNVFSIALGDLNGDGLLDIVVGNFNAFNALLINENNGSNFAISFLNDKYVASKTRAVALIDINGDGHLDIFVGNDNCFRLTEGLRCAQNSLMLINDGKAKFEMIELPKQHFSDEIVSGEGLPILSVAVGDVNNDGMDDIVLGMGSSKASKVLINTGDNLFGIFQVLPVVYETLVRLADVDGDGFLDILFGSLLQAVGPCKLSMNNGRGKFITPTNLPGGTDGASDIAAGDLNGDGKVDVIILRSKQGLGMYVLQLLINSGEGSFESQLEFEVPDARKLAFGDINKDGVLDIVLGMVNDQTNQIVTIPQGGFTGASIGASKSNLNEFSQNFKLTNLPNQEYFDPRSFAQYDFNDDGILDLVVVYNTGHMLLFLSNIEKSYDVKGFPETEDRVGVRIRIGDLDGDGKQDLVYAYESGVYYYFGLGIGEFSDYKQLPTENSQITDIALGDLSGSSTLDIVLCTANERQQNLIFYNQGRMDDRIDFDVKFFPGKTLSSSVVTLGDLDGNGLLDIVLGNNDVGNNVFLNNDPANASFNITEITPTPKNYRNYTESIALGDLNGDGYLDIVIGYDRVCDLVLINDGNGSYKKTCLGGEGTLTRAVVLADFDGDNITDIIVGYEGGLNKIFLNQGGDALSFKSIDLPGNAQDRTFDIIVNDLNGDGVLEVISLADNVGVTATFYSSCPDGGAQPYSGSWCFKCPNYMGRPLFLGNELSSCIECMPDYLQEQGIGEQCSSDKCFLAERKLGSKECIRCGVGTYYDNILKRMENNSTTWEPDRCVSCPAGTYRGADLEAINKCFKCEAGTAQPNKGEAKCNECLRGTFQPDRGGTLCMKCAKGGYCDKNDGCNGGFTPCPPGTYNDQEGKNDASACIPCPKGTFNNTKEVTSRKFCTACPKGSYNDEEGATKCKECPLGKFQKDSNQTQCDDCSVGTYADKLGLFECIPCPYRTSSFTGSDTCGICAESFYLNDTSIIAKKIFDSPTKYCLSCPTQASCNINTTLQTIQIPKSYWRDSLDTSKLYECQNDVCTGSQTKVSNRRLNTINNGRYCKEGHTGPRCEYCTKEGQYFSTLVSECTDCPGLTFYFIAIPSLAAVGAAWYFISRLPVVQKRIEQMRIIFSTISAQAKMKILISFYQVVGNLGPVYGITLDGSVKAWFHFLSFFDLNLDIFIPGQCIGSMETRMIINALWPFGIAFIGFLVIVILTILKRRNPSTDGGPQQKETDFKTEVWGRTLYFIIIFIYLVLPGVSRGVFAALRCESFTTNDEKGLSNSYLTADLKIYCRNVDGDADEHSTLLKFFWGFFILWPLLIPILMFLVLMRVREAVRTKRITPLAEAVSFLWRDYSESFFYWEIIDLFRKIFLTGIILTVDKDEGSDKVLRLLIAILVSVLYFGFLLRARPYKRSNDLDLAFVSHVLLLSCFVVGISLHLCDNESDCKRFIMTSFSSMKATLFAVGLTAVMLIISAIFLIILTVNAITAPTIRLVSSGSKPNLEMSGEHEFHCFLSHIWSTGKDKTHTIARKTQLLLPGVKIWLDVDNLSQMDQLETSVGTSAVILIFYSKGYFRSKNCRREVYAAVEMDKPIYIIYEGDDFVLEEAREECRRFCTEGYDVVGRVFAMNPILWLGGGGAQYALESVKMVSFSILKNLPIYQKRPGELAPGLKVEGELGPVSMTEPVDVFVCAGNVGARRVVEEARSTIPKQTEFINIIDGGALLDIDETFEDDTTGKKQYLLLYLDEDVFLDEGEEVYETVRKAILMNIELITIHEQDTALGACAFETFFGQTPADLIEPPYAIYKEIAVPLFPAPEYRKVSIRQLLMKFGATETKLAKKSSAAGNVSQMLKNMSFRSFRPNKSESKKNASAKGALGSIKEDEEK